MKTLVKIAFLATTLIFTSCSSDDDSTTPPPVDIAPLIFECSEIRELAGQNYTFVDRGAIIDYIIPCVVALDANIIIEPGVTIAFENDAGFSVRSSGSLNAVGTETQPIILTSTNTTIGDWKGILIDSDNNANRFEHVTINYAGGGQFNSNGDLGSIIVWADAQIDIVNCNILNSQDKGINLAYYGADIAIENTTITNCLLPIQGYSEYISNISGGNYIGNTTDVIRIIGQGSNSAGTWTKLNVPYRINGKVSVNNTSLTIDPGVIIEMENGAWFDVGDQDTATLKAIGTPSEPILFTGVVKQPGAWKGIQYEFTNSVENEISYATLEYAGNGSDFDGGAIYLWANPTVNLNNLIIKDTPGCGIQYGTNTGTNNATIFNIDYQNTGGTVCLP